MFSRVNVWQITESKLAGVHSAIRVIHISKIYMALFGKSQTICQICQTFPKPNIPAIL